MSDRRQHRKDSSGQSLVEMAILFPLLIFIFIGLIEVGWAIRGYLTTVSLSRETVRYAIRPEILDFSAPTPGWGSVAQHYQAVAQDQYYDLVLTGTEDEVNGTLWLSYRKVDVGYPCDPEIGCLRECESYTPIEWHYQDDLIITPTEVPTYSWQIGINQASPRDEPSLTRRLIQENNILNCRRWLLNPTGYQTRTDEVIVAEIMYYQPQILGFPVLRYILDPVPLYAQTTMRRRGR